MVQPKRSSVDNVSNHLRVAKKAKVLVTAASDDCEIPLTQPDAQNDSDDSSSSPVEASRNPSTMSNQFYQKDNEQLHQFEEDALIKVFFLFSESNKDQINGKSLPELFKLMDDHPEYVEMVKFRLLNAIEKIFEKKELAYFKNIDVVNKIESLTLKGFIEYLVDYYYENIDESNKQLQVYSASTPEASLPPKTNDIANINTPLRLLNQCMNVYFPELKNAQKSFIAVQPSEYKGYSYIAVKYLGAPQTQVIGQKYAFRNFVVQSPFGISCYCSQLPWGNSRGGANDPNSENYNPKSLYAPPELGKAQFEFQLSNKSIDDSGFTNTAMDEFFEYVKRIENEIYTQLSELLPTEYKEIEKEVSDTIKKYGIPNNVENRIKIMKDRTKAKMFKESNGIATLKVSKYLFTNASETQKRDLQCMDWSSAFGEDEITRLCKSENKVEAPLNIWRCRSNEEREMHGKEIVFESIPYTATNDYMGRNNAIVSVQFGFKVVHNSQDKYLDVQMEPKLILWNRFREITTNSAAYDPMKISFEFAATTDEIKHKQQLLLKSVIIFSNSF